MNTKKDKLHLKHWNKITVILVICDLLSINISYFLALWMRFDGVVSEIPERYLMAYLQFVPLYSVCCVVFFLFFHLYRSIWKFVSSYEAIRILLANIVTAAIHTAGITWLVMRMPISYYLYGSFFQFFFTISVRFSYRLFLYFRKVDSSDLSLNRVMIIGAGSAGQMIIKDLNHSTGLKDKVVCIIDDDPNKWNRYIEGIPIVGGRDDISASIKKYGIDKIFIAIPSASGKQRKDILNICEKTACIVKQLPGMCQLVRDEISISSVDHISVEQLLSREPVKTNLDEVFHYINEKVILVTGGGGSIGSELCRQIASHNPHKLIIFDIYENNAYAIQLELKKKYPDLDMDVLIGSVQDSRKIFQVFEEFHPDVVYHAAAHKHVPLMEDSPCEAIKNNVIGTYKTAYAAMIHNCQRFVLISTDKAVNPTNIMGASKRLCEMVVQAFDKKIKEGEAKKIPQLFTHIEKKNLERDDIAYQEIKTEFVSVRFGNVLGSNGSVIPIFKRQIEQGGPVTVTHPDITRYFMTIPEAVSLVLLAGTYAKGGEIFILDMGEPVKIDDLARNIIRLSGYIPDEEIKIEYVGLRPGEKLYEEKLMAEEGILKTDNKLIHIGKPIAFDIDKFLVQLAELMENAYSNKKNIREMVGEIVVTYKPL